MSALNIDVREHVGWFTFNRPEIGNAINQDLMRTLDQALTQVQHPSNSIRCLVLSGAGQNFCSGIDLRSTQIPRTGSPDTQTLMARSYLDHIVERLLSLRVPIVAAVNGAAAGAGMTLALTADVIVMAENAYFWPSFAKLGLVPDNGITCLLSEHIGASRARTVLMLGDRIEARTAKDWGLAYEVVVSERLHLKASEFATRLATGPRCVLGATRSLLHQPDARGFRKQIQAEREAHAHALSAQEHVEGCAAFFEHREPKF